MSGLDIFTARRRAISSAHADALVLASRRRSHCASSAWARVARPGPEQLEQIVRRIDVERDARKVNDQRFDAASARRGEMRQEAVVAEAQRHRGRRRADDGIGAAPVARRHDGEGARPAVGGKQLPDVCGLEQRNVARQRQQAKTLRRQALRRRRDRGGVSGTCVLGETCAPWRPAMAAPAGSTVTTRIPASSRTRASVAKTCSNMTSVNCRRCASAKHAGKPLLGLAACP